MKTVIQSWITVLALFSVCQCTRAEVMAVGEQPSFNTKFRKDTYESKDVVAIAIIYLLLY